jgi:5,10-methylenetetrahydromethanopterin reductase
LFDLSISSDGRDTPEQFLQKLDIAEQGGARALWIANHLFLRDPVSLAATSLARTKNLHLVLMAVSPLTMHPVQAAMSAATLDEMFPGRITLCFGVGAPADLNALSIEAEKPLKLMREALKVTRALLAGETVKYEGDHFSVASRGLVTGPRKVPLFLAASGPGMLELAGAEADGVLISAGASLPFVEQTLEHVRRGAKGRKVRTQGLVYTSIDDSEVAANDRLRRLLAILLRGAHHRANLEAAGNKLEQAALNDAVLSNDWAKAEGLITDRIVQQHAASGTREQLKQRFSNYHRAGLDEVVVAGAREPDQISRILKIQERMS